MKQTVRMLAVAGMTLACLVACQKKDDASAAAGPAEQAGRKLLGGLLGRMGGGLARGLGQQAVSSGMSFVATYALGHVAKRYYAGGRTLSTQMLKEAYAGISSEAQALQGRYLPQMQQQAQTMDVGKVLSMVRGRA